MTSNSMSIVVDFDSPEATAEYNTIRFGASIVRRGR